MKFDYEYQQFVNENAVNPKGEKREGAEFLFNSDLKNLFN
jgi:hypothetical protein